MRWIAILLLGLVSGGCVQPPTSEKDVFDDITQLTSGFKAAGEAYFSNDMQWIIFQATPPNEEHYQMYIARLLRDGDRVTGIGQAIRVSPPDSRNTCGFFSPDGVSVIFASTAGKEDKTEMPSGYQRGGGEYRWPFPRGMEIFRADAWQGAIAATEFSRGINLAKNPLTDNDTYDAECVYSPDGNWILFTSTRDGDPTRAKKTSRDADLYVMRADGTQVTRLTKADGYDGGAFFSPDMQKIVFRADRMNNNLLQIFVADVLYDSAGNITGLAREQQLTRDAAVHFGPYWHPDNLHIVYAANINERHEYELLMMRVDGTRKVRLTFTPGPDLLPVFSPDGKYLMWTSKRSSDGTSQIYIAKFKMPKAG
jgi:Tol biopolymer transport system component